MITGSPGRLVAQATYERVPAFPLHRSLTLRVRVLRLGCGRIDAGRDLGHAIGRKPTAIRVLAHSILVRCDVDVGDQATIHIALHALHIPTHGQQHGFERTYRDRAHAMVFLEVDPQLAGMERNPRYAALLARVGLK